MYILFTKSLNLLSLQRSDMLPNCSQFVFFSSVDFSSFGLFLSYLNFLVFFRYTNLLYLVTVILGVISLSLFWSILFIWKKKTTTKQPFEKIFKIKSSKLNNHVIKVKYLFLEKKLKTVKMCISA